jgi:hypothetical protein
MLFYSTAHKCHVELISMLGLSEIPKPFPSRFFGKKKCTLVAVPGISFRALRSAMPTRIILDYVFIYNKHCLNKIDFAHHASTALTAVLLVYV